MMRALTIILLAAGCVTARPEQPREPEPQSPRISEQPTAEYVGHLEASLCRTSLTHEPSEFWRPFSSETQVSVYADRAMTVGMGHVRAVFYGLPVDSDVWLVLLSDFDGQICEGFVSGVVPEDFAGVALEFNGSCGDAPRVMSQILLREEPFVASGRREVEGLTVIEVGQTYRATGWLGKVTGILTQDVPLRDRDGRLCRGRVTDSPYDDYEIEGELTQPD